MTSEVTNFYSLSLDLFSHSIQIVKTAVYSGTNQRPSKDSWALNMQMLPQAKFKSEKIDNNLSR
jgi:hypothetical protein